MEFAERVNWQTFKGAVEDLCVSVNGTEVFAQATLDIVAIYKVPVDLPSRRGVYDSEYERLRELQHRSEKNTKETKDDQHVTEAKRMRKQIKIHLDKLPKHWWRRFCANLGP